MPLVEQVKPLPRGKVVHESLTQWMRWTARNFDAGRDHHAWIVWTVTAVLPALAAWGMFVAVSHLNALLGLAFDIALRRLTRHWVRWAAQS